MRTIDDQLREIVNRAGWVREKKALRKRLWAGALSSCACVVLLIAASFYLPLLETVSVESSGGRYGSLLLTAPGMGYAVVGILAFILGISVTMLCISWKKLKLKELKRK